MSEKTHDTGFAWFPASHWILPGGDVLRHRSHASVFCVIFSQSAQTNAGRHCPDGGLAPRTYRRLRRLREASRPEFRIAMLAFAGVLFFGLLNGLLLAAAGSLVMLIASRPTVVVLGREPTTGRFVIRDQYPDAGDPAGALVVRSAGGWFRSHPAADQRSGRSRSR